MNTLLLATILGLFSAILITTVSMGFGIRTPLVAAIFTGLMVGDVALGFEIGATTTLLSIGFYTYGGATIPD